MVALSNRRFNAHGPSNLSAESRPGISGTRLRLADPEAAPLGHVTVLGALPACALWTVCPSTLSTALSASPFSEVGVKVIDTNGVDPPDGKKAPRISAADWNAFKVDFARSRLERASCFQVHSWPVMSISGARFCAKKRSINPPGANSLAKSAIEISSVASP